MSWLLNTEALDTNTIKHTIQNSLMQSLSFAEAFHLLETHSDFRNVFNQALANTPFDAYFWELPALTSETANRPFECVTVNSNAFTNMRGDPSSFAAYFEELEPESYCAIFKNLGGDAWLISPTSHKTTMSIPHIALFVRNASEDCIHELWKTLAVTVREKLNHNPLWISTSGLGVPWLHIRLDRRPKYYTFLPYKTSQKD